MKSIALIVILMKLIEKLELLLLKEIKNLLEGILQKIVNHIILKLIMTL